LRYCEKCGASIRFDNADFCPFCGAKIPPAIPRLSKEKRALIFFGVLLLSIFVTFIGLMECIPLAEAQNIRERYAAIDEFMLDIGIPYIFGNNLIICLFMFIPLLGLINGFFVLYRTGRVIATLSIYSGVDPLVTYSILWTEYLHTSLEYIASALALSEGIILSYYLLRYKWRGLKLEAKNVPIILSCCVLILFFAAIMEVAAII